MPSLALKASVNYPFIGGGSFTPNYPPGLSYTTGLLGWYDSSQPSSIVKDGSNNVSQWNNLFNGATQGATVLPAFTIPSGNTAPVYVTGQSYLYGTSSGSKTGVSFDGVSALLSTPSISSLGLNDLAIFASIKPSSSITGPQIGLDDKQIANYLSVGIQSGLDPITNSTLSIFGTNITNSNSTQDNNYAFGFQGVKSGATSEIFYLYQYNTGSAIFQTWNSSGTGAVAADLPWNQISLGGDIASSVFQQSLIGEVLVFQMTAAQQGGSYANVKTIINYLQGRWN
jgi:hypothetical protein